MRVLPRPSKIWLVTIVITIVFSATTWAQDTSRDTAQNAIQETDQAPSQPLILTPVAEAKGSPHEEWERIRFSNPVATMTYAIKPEVKITNLKWVVEPLPVQTETGSDGEETYFVEFQGNYVRPDWSLIRITWRLGGGSLKREEDSVPITPDKNGDFNIRVVLDQDVVGADLMAVGPLGEVERETVAAFFQNLDRFEVFRKEQREKPKSRFRATLGLGITLVSYAQPDGQSVDETNLTGKLGIDFALVPKKWSVGANAFATAVTLSANPSALAIKFVGGNFRIGYQIQDVPAPWSVIVMAGLYFTTTFSKPDDLGYSGIAGPQLFPVVLRTFEDGSSASVYFKYSPIISGLSLLSPSNAEIATGVSYFLKPIEKGFLRGSSIGFTFDASWLSLNTAAGATTASSYTLGSSLRF